MFGILQIGRRFPWMWRLPRHDVQIRPAIAEPVEDVSAVTELPEPVEHVPLRAPQRWSPVRPALRDEASRHLRYSYGSASRAPLGYNAAPHLDYSDEA